MRRLVASALVALSLPALARAAEPLDLDLSRLGAPDAAVWEALGETDAARRQALASAAKARFGVLSTEVALALSSALLQPASTTGHSGFDFALETAYVQVNPTRFPSATASGFAESNWPTRDRTPDGLLLPSVHVRKALPYSLELGGRLIYLAQSSYFAGQAEAKWALHEGFDAWPDVAVRVAWTRLFGQRDWTLQTGDVDLLVSKRWGVNAVTSFTPYAAARLTFVDASTGTIAFAPADPAATIPTSAAFPDVRWMVYRTTAGVRMTAAAVSLALEATYFSGGRYSGEDLPAARQNPDFEVDPSIGGAFRLGFEF